MSVYTISQSKRVGPKSTASVILSAGPSAAGPTEIRKCSTYVLRTRLRLWRTSWSRYVSLKILSWRIGNAPKCSGSSDRKNHPTGRGSPQPGNQYEGVLWRHCESSSNISIDAFLMNLGNHVEWFFLDPGTLHMNPRLGNG